MVKQTWVKVNGVWQKVKSAWANVGGTWKKDVMPKGNIGGDWKEFMSYSVFPPYLYLEGKEGVSWVEGHKTTHFHNARSKESTYLYLESDSSSSEAAIAWVTEEAVDLTSYNKLSLFLPLFAGLVSLIASASKTGDYNTYDARAQSSTSIVMGEGPRIAYDKTVELDVSDLSGSFYIRFHAESVLAFTQTYGSVVHASKTWLE